MTAGHSRRRFLGSSGLLLAGLGVPGLTSCGGGSGSGGQVSLRMFWSGSQETNRILLSVIKAFEKANSKIDIRPEYGAGGGAADKLNTQIAGGRAPDLIVMSTSSMSDYVKRKVIFPLDEYTSSVIDLSDFDKRVVANATIDASSTPCHSVSTRPDSSTTGRSSNVPASTSRRRSGRGTTSRTRPTS